MYFKEVQWNYRRALLFKIWWSLTRISKYFDFSFATFRRRSLFILFVQQFWTGVTSKYTNHSSSQKHLYSRKRNISVNFWSWVSINWHTNNLAQQVKGSLKMFSFFSFHCGQHASSFKPRIMSLKWLSLSKIQKKIQTTPLQAGLQEELFSASEMLVSSIQVRYEARNHL